MESPSTPALEPTCDLLARLEAAKERLEELVDGLPTALLIADARGAILKGNQRAADMLGVAPESIEQHRLGDTLLPPLLEAIEGFTGDTATTMTRLQRKGGPALHVRWTISRFGKTTFLLSGVDVSQMRSYERRLETTVAATRAMVSSKEALDVILCALRFLAHHPLDEWNGFYVDATTDDTAVFRFECRPTPGKEDEPRVTFLCVEPASDAHQDLLADAFDAPRPRISDTNDLLIPLGLHGRRLGLLVFEGVGACAEIQEDLLFFEIISHSMAIVLQNVETIRELEIKARIEGEYEAVEMIQNRFLGRSTFLDSADVIVHYAPAERVSGDWIGYHHDAANDILYLYVADITGHGITAAVMTGVLCGSVFSAQHLLSTTRRETTLQTLQAVGHAVNEVFLRAGGHDHLATLLLGAVDLRTGKTCLASAGHPPTMLLKHATREVRSLPAPGSVLGFSTNCVLGVREIELEPGDSLLMYTDGLVENRNMYGKTLNLRKLLNSEAETFNAEDVIQCIQEHSQTLKLVDDMAIMVCQWHGQRSGL